MHSPTKVCISETVEKQVLLSLEKTLRGEETRSFEEVCEEDKKTFGSRGSDKRRDCQTRRNQFLKTRKRSIKNYNKFLEKFGIPIEGPLTMAPQDESTKKQPSRTATTSSAKKDEPKSTAAQAKTSTEPVSLGKWVYLKNGQEVYADRVVEISLDPMECGLNPYVDLVQNLPTVRFDTPNAIVKTRCFSLLKAAEVNDVELIDLRQTLIPNALALTIPLLPASLRCDIVESDQQADQRKKLLNVSRNFKVRDAKTKKMKDFWVPEAWEEHETTLSKIAESQAEDGKEFVVATRIILLVFPSNVRLCSKVCPALVDQDSGVIMYSCEGFKNGSQGISRMRWLVTTDDTTIVRKKAKDKAPVSDLAAQIKDGFTIDDEDDEEGMI